ncbi:MAG: MBL fold metallo-hydrolase [Methylocystaceae bacterium]
MLLPISDRVHLVVNETGFTYSNCLLIEDDVRLLIDSGAGDALQEADPAHIDLLLNTHHHIDHIRGNDQCTAAKIMTHPLEVESMQSLNKLTATDGWQELMGEEIIMDPAALNAHFEICDRVDGVFNDEQVFDTGHMQLQVLHTPGHSTGHCAFWVPDADLVFLGDICLSKVGPWYGGPEADIDSLLTSIDRIIELKPGRLTTGHINHIVSENITGVLTEYRDRIGKREQRILRHLKQQPADIDTLTDHHYIYRLHPTPFVVFWEKYMLKKHLERLLSQGEIEEIEPGLYQAR